MMVVDMISLSQGRVDLSSCPRFMHSGWPRQKNSRMGIGYWRIWMGQISIGGMVIPMYALSRFVSLLILALAVPVVATSSSQPGKATAVCYPMEPAKVALRGVVVTDAGGSFFLILDAPICVKGEGFGGNVIAENVVRMHLAPQGDNGVKELRDAIGKDVELYGNLFDWHTAHHKTPILMAVDKVRRLFEP